MAHPIIGIWQVEIELQGRRTHVTHAYHPDGLMHLDAGEHGAGFLWQPTGERTVRIRGSRPVEPDIARFIGWQYADGEAEVSEDGRSFSGRETTDAPRSDGGRETREATLRGTRVSFDDRPTD